VKLQGRKVYASGSRENVNGSRVFVKENSVNVSGHVVKDKVYVEKLNA